MYLQSLDYINIIAWSTDDIDEQKEEGEPELWQKDNCQYHFVIVCWQVK